MLSCSKLHYLLLTVWCLVNVNDSLGATVYNPNFGSFGIELPYYG